MLRSPPLPRWSLLVTLLVLLLTVVGCGSASMSGAKASEAPGSPGGGWGAPMREESVSLTASDAEMGGDGEASVDTMTSGNFGAAAQAAPRNAPAARPAPPPDPQGGNAGPRGPTAPAATQPDVPPRQPGTDVPPPGTGTAAGGAAQAPLLIYTAEVTLAVFEREKTLNDAEQLARDLGGYLVRRDDTTLVFRVPAREFDGALEKVLGLGDVLQRNVSVEDVTDQFLDLSTRLRNYEVMRLRLEALLEKAEQVDEALQVERELARVAGEIERIKGRLKLLRELISFSTITLRIQPRAVEHLGSRVHMPFSWLGQLGLSGLLSL